MQVACDATLRKNVGVPATPRPPAPTAVQRVHAYVKEAVISGEVGEGTMLSEGQIATELGVSRTPVREAFVQLESLGYLRLYPKRGALVVPVSREEVGPVIDTRWVVERHGIEAAAGSGASAGDPNAGGRSSRGPDQRALAAIEATLDAQAEHIAAGNLSAFADADGDFHQALAAATGNPILIDLYDTLRDRQRRMTRGMVLDSAARAQAFLAQHREIYDAIAAGDAAGATAKLRAHLDHARETLLS